MEHVNGKMLNISINELNKITGNAVKPYTKIDDYHLQRNIGHYHIDNGYKGLALVQYVNIYGAVKLTFGYERLTKRALFEQLRTYIAGIQVGKELKVE